MSSLSSTIGDPSSTREGSYWNFVPIWVSPSWVTLTSEIMVSLHCFSNIRRSLSVVTGWEPLFSTRYDSFVYLFSLEPSLSKHSYFDMPAPPFEKPQRGGASLGDYTLTNEAVSLYFLALLRAYMDVQDRVEKSRFPDSKQAEEAMRLDVMKRLEQNVFISFGALYVIVHLIFIFILWFDVRLTFYSFLSV